jgi:hypothetical protein
MVKGGTAAETVMDVAGGESARTVTVSALTNGEEYLVRIRARNSMGNGAWSTAATGTPKAATTTTTPPGDGPAKVAEPTVEPGDKMLKVSWSAPASSRTITHYNVRYRASSATDWEPKAPKAAMSVSAMEAEITGLINGTVYLVQVQAVDAADAKGDWSDAGSGTPVAGAEAPMPTPALPAFGAIALVGALAAAGRRRIRQRRLMAAKLRYLPKR